MLIREPSSRLKVCASLCRLCSLVVTAGFGQGIWVLCPKAEDSAQILLPNPGPTALQHRQGAQENTQGDGTETH